MTRVDRLAGLALVSTLVLAGSACVAPRTPTPGRTALAVPDTIRVRTGNRVVTVPFEAYVLGSALSEVSPVGETPDTAARIFFVQAVLARTYALAHLNRHGTEGFDLCDTTHCQLYEPDRIRTSRFADIARDAVASTRHVVITYRGRAADAVYHADCGGHTASADAVWGGPPVDYLVANRDDVPAGTHRQWTFDVSLDRLEHALKTDPRTAIDHLRQVTIARTDLSGRTTLLQVQGTRTQAVAGDTFRAIVSRAFGPRALLSTRFTVVTSSESVRFAGTGFGHGVGLCQTGAAARARQGTSPAMIFAAYFPGTTLVQVGPAPLTAGGPKPSPFPGLLQSP